jgi:hypothetical protein
MAEMYRQGDVLLTKVSELPKKAVEQKSEGRIVLAWGEVTGHAHAIASDVATLYQLGPDRFVVAQPGAALTHEEHATINLTPGVYRVIQQREYVPGAFRNVAD